MKDLEKKYCDMLSQIQPREIFEQELLTTLMDIQSKRKKPKTKVRKGIIRRQLYQAAACGICCIGIILIGMLTPVSAAIRDIYQRFYQNADINYGKSSVDHGIAINQQIITENGSKIYIEDGVLTDKGMSLCYEIKSKEKGTDIYPGEIQLKTKDGIKIYMHQTAYMPASGKADNKKYFASFETDQMDDLEKLLGSKTNGSFEFLEEKQDGEVRESLADISFTPESVYSLKTLEIRGDWIQTKKSGNYRISKITMDVWYMKVEYQWEKKGNQAFTTFELSDEKGKKYVSLGAELEENEKDKSNGTIFYELPDKKSEKMIFSPVQLTENKQGEQKEEKLSGQSIRVTKEDINGRKYYDVYRQIIKQKY